MTKLEETDKWQSGSYSESEKKDHPDT